MSRTAIRILLLTAVSALVAAAQTETPAFVVDQCVKALPGKITELSSFLRNVSVKRARVRVDEGKAAWWLVVSPVAPAGAEARCDFRIVTGYRGAVPEPAPAPPAQADAELRKAGGLMFRRSSAPNSGGPVSTLAHTSNK